MLFSFLSKLNVSNAGKNGLPVTKTNLFNQLGVTRACDCASKNWPFSSNVAKNRISFFILYTLMGLQVFGRSIIRQCFLPTLVNCSSRFICTWVSVKTRSGNWKQRWSLLTCQSIWTCQINLEAHDVDKKRLQMKQRKI